MSEILEAAVAQTDATPPSADEICRRILASVAAGHTEVARLQLRAAAVRQQLAEPTRYALEAEILRREGHLGDALNVLDQAVALSPTDASLRTSRAAARLAAGTPAEAARDAAEAVLLAPSESTAKAVLGIALLECGAVADAVSCLRESLVDVPAGNPVRVALAEALCRSGAHDEAVAILREGLSVTPRAPELWRSLVMMHFRTRDFAAAEAIARAAIAAGSADACISGLLGHALSVQGRHLEALDAYHAALRAAPEDGYVRHLVAGGGLVADGGRAPREYVRALFNGYADRFDSHLVSLRYRVPGLVRRALLSWRAAGESLPEGGTLDIGCGTGLLAVAAGDLMPQPLTGIDVSPRMLERARERSLYADLIEADIMDDVPVPDGCRALVVAGDVLPYFGDLRPVLARAAAWLRPGGRAVLSLERAPQGMEPSGWRLGRAGRYAHHASHVHAAAEDAGLTLMAMVPENLRLEGDAPVEGWIVTLGRPPSAP